MRLDYGIGPVIGLAGDLPAPVSYTHLDVYKRQGEAIAWGMLAALQIALARSTVAPDQAQRIERTILDYGPLPAFRTTPAKLLDAAGRDKKNRAGTRRLSLIHIY